MNPKEVRERVLRALNEHDIMPVLSRENMPLMPRGLTYGPGYIKFFRQCCNRDLHALHYIKVVNGEVYVEFNGQVQRIDTLIHTLDEEETLEGRFAALMYDPRWLITKIRDIQCNEHEDGSTHLIGNIYPGECGIVIRELLYQLEYETKEQILKKFFEGTRNEFTAKQWEKFKKLKREYKKLPVEELRARLRNNTLVPWGFEITVNETFLPVLVKTTERGPRGMGFFKEGMHFNYAPKNTGNKTP